ncbi:MAG: hypothetical protein ACK5L9_11675 [Paracoccus sp. (in: a-proteobacteria)]
MKKKLKIGPLHADTVRMIYRLALEGDGMSGPMGVKATVNHLNCNHIFTRNGGGWGIGQLYRVLTRRTYIVLQALQEVPGDAGEGGCDRPLAPADRQGGL